MKKAAGARDEEVASAVVTLTYDAAGNPASRTDAKGTSYTTYDGRNQLVETIDAIEDTTLTQFSACGLVVSSTDPSGLVTRHQYDVRGLETAATVGSNTSTPETTTG